jgi:hypothetical protein
MDLLEELKALTAKLDQEGIDYALCGGLAMAIYARPRATLDIDLMIDSSSLFPAKRAVEALGYTAGAEPMELDGGRVQIYRCCKMGVESAGELVLDLLLVTPDTRRVWEGRLKVEWEGGAISVVSPEGLIFLKSIRGSGQDRDDIEYLRSIIDED